MTKKGEEEPNWLEKYALLCFRRPGLVFGIIVGALILLAVGAGSQLALSETEGNEWLIKDDVQTERDIAIDEALDEFGKSSGKQPTRSEEEGEYTLTFIHRVKRGEKNIFTEENLQSIYEVESEVFNFKSTEGKGNYTSYCVLDYSDDPDNPVCERPLSLLNIFYEYDVETGAYGDRNDLSIEDGIQLIRDDIFDFGFHVDKTFNETSMTEFTRSQYYFGTPLEGFENSFLMDDEQGDRIKDDFLSKVESNLWETLDMDKRPLRTRYADIGEEGNLEVIFFSFELNEDEFTRVVVTDFMWAFLSIFSVWVYMLIHLGSVFLATVGIFEVFMSFPAAYFFYKIVFQIKYFDFLHLLVIFILLGIGADDVFVFTDAFKQSKSVRGVGTSLQARLMYTSRRASKAVFVTSFTTVAAFLATATSSLMPMQAFGIFAALCIAFLFIVNVLLMPAALVLWAGYTPWCVRNICPCFGKLHERFNCSQKVPCCGCCHVDPDETFDMPYGNPVSERDVAQQEMQMTETIAGSTPQNSDHQHETKVNVESAKPQDIVEEDLTQLRSLERFFHGRYLDFIFKFRWILVVTGVLAFVGGLVLVSTFETPDSAEQWWPSYHSFNKFTKYMDRGGPFIASGEDDVTEVHLVWGLRGMSNSFDRFDPDDFGKVQFDDEFDITSQAAQTHLMDVCKAVRNEKCRENTAECERRGNPPGFLVLLNRESEVPLEEQAPCWIEAFDTWLNDEKEESIPLPADEVIPRLQEFSNTSIARVGFPDDLGFIEEDGERKLKFVQFHFDSTFQAPASSSRTKPVVASWEDFMKKQNKIAEEEGATGVSRGFQTGRDSWTWVETQEALLRNALSGVILVFVLAFVVLNIATQNIVISAIALFTVAGVVSCVLGFGIRGVMGWDLGVAESIVSVILIGFSMDYTLHLADAYIESGHEDRKRRTQDSLTHLGISVTAGALTTLISGLFLWFTVLTFFTKFAFNITATIITSYLWSVMFFPAACLTFGPEGDFGNWSRMLKKIGITRERCCPCLPKKDAN